MREGQEIASRDVLGIPVVDFSRAEALDWIHGRIADGSYTPVTFLNAHNANLAMRDTGFREALRRFTIMSDGIGVDIAARLLHGRQFRANLNGTDFVPAVLTSARVPLKVGLVGAAPGIADEAARHFASLDARHEYRVIHNGYFEASDESQILDGLLHWKPDILLVAMGVPKQELWIAEKLTAAHCTVAMGIGALFDFASGAVPRAPHWVRALRSEWVYRLIREPRRLGHRYLVGNPVFLGNVVRWMFDAGSKHP
ncbi:MAG: WecB/TagA/CpsF family glycosyltransferase [Hyphomicrobiales bacterium]|nr:WecB/TagA/CpsF family glycosyltransferase [Hyphomicrobiales bacterium]